MSSLDLGINLRLNDQLSKSIGELKSKFGQVNSQIQGMFARTGHAVQTLRTKVNSFATSFQQNWASMIAQMYLLIQAFRLIESSAKFSQQKTAFKNLSASVNANGDEMIAKLKEMSANTLSTAEVMQQASRAMVLGLSPDQLPRLMEIARASARAFGEDVDFMFESIVLGIGRQSRMILDNLGIIVKAEDAYEKYATELGVTAKELTDLQRRQAFANAVMQAGEGIIKKVNVQQKTQLEQMQSMKALWSDLKVKMGDFLLFSIQGLTLLGQTINLVFFESLGRVAEFMGELVLKMADMAQALEDITNKIPGVTVQFDGLIDRLRLAGETQGAFADGFKENADEIRLIAEELSVLISGANEKAGKSFKKLGDVAGDAGKDLKVTSESMFEAFTSAVGSLGSSMAQAQEMGKGFAVASAVIAMGMAIVNTAVGVTDRLKNKEGFPWPVPMILAGIVASAGALQVASIASQKFHDGGMIKAHNGLAVDEVPIIAQTGEGILSRRGMANLGGSGALNGLNSGSSVGGGGEVNVNIYNPRFSNKDDIKELTNLIGVEIDRQLRYAR